MKIETKFDLNQKIYDIYGNCWTVAVIKLAYNTCGELEEYYILEVKGTMRYECCVLPRDEDIFFATREEATKEKNYIKACRLVKKLFLGEEV